MKKIDQFFTSTTPRNSKRQRSSSSPDVTVTDPNSGMDNEKVGDLTHAQLMAGLSTLLDQKLDQKLSKLATKEDLVQISGQVDSLSKECNLLREEVNSLKQQGYALSSKIIDLEARSRRNNLIFRGLNVPENTTDYCSVVKRFCCEVLGTGDGMWVNRAHRLGAGNSAIIAHIPDDVAINHIMSNVKKLKGTKFVVHRDYPREVRQKRAVLAKVRAEVEKVSGRRRMPIVHDHLFIEGCRFTWDGGLRAGLEDGAKRLKELLGRDYTGFLNRLQQDDEGRGRSKPPGQRMSSAEQSRTSGDLTTSRP